ncbi:hypothetical protein V8E54_008158 [Elaphomyces granulatus]
MEETVQQWRSPVLPGDPNLDPFYLERALKRESDILDRFDQPFASSPPLSYHRVNVPPLSYHRVNVPPLSLTTTQPPERLSHAPSGVQHRGFESTHSRYPSSGTPVSYSQISYCSLQSDATTLTPDLTPSSSFSSTYSIRNCLEDVWKVTEPLTLHGGSGSPPNNAASHQLYLPMTPPDELSDPWTSSTTIQMATPRLRSGNTSSETLTMDPKPNSSPPPLPPPPPPPPPSPAYLYSKPLPNLPSSSPSATTPTSPTLPKKSFSSPSRSQIDPTSISSPILLNPVTLEPHASHLDCAFFIPANGCPSAADITPPPTAPSRASIVISNHEQSVWESDSDSGSVVPRSQSRRTPIETLRKVRSRVQLRRTAKSEDKIAAMEPSCDGSTQEKMPALPPLDPRVLNVLPPLVKQPPLHLIPPPSSSPSSHPHSLSRKSGDRDGNEMTTAAIHAQTRHRPKINNNGLPDDPSSRDANCDSYTSGPHTIDQATDLTLSRPGLFKRVWSSLQTLNCQKPSYRKTIR